MLFPRVSERYEDVEGNLKEVVREGELEGNSQASDDSSAKRDVTMSEKSKKVDESKGGVSVESEGEGDSAVKVRAESSESGSANENENSSESGSANKNENSNENDNATSNENEISNANSKPESQPLEEDRDPRLSRYSKRFTFSRHKFSLDDIEDSNKTYYPADHMREGNLWAVRKTLMEREKTELETWRPALESELKHYEDMSSYLSFEENLEKYVSRDEIDKLNALRGREQTNYRKKLNNKIQVKSRFDTQRREKKRKQLFSQMQLVDKGPVCDGCPTETRHALKPSAYRDTVVRKFVGNEEQFTIYNSTHCTALHRP